MFTRKTRSRDSEQARMSFDMYILELIQGMV